VTNTITLVTNTITLVTDTTHPSVTQVANVKLQFPISTCPHQELAHTDCIALQILTPLITSNSTHVTTPLTHSVQLATGHSHLPIT